MILESKTHKGEISDMREIWSVEVTFELYLASQKKKKKWLSVKKEMGSWDFRGMNSELPLSGNDSESRAWHSG